MIETPDTYYTDADIEMAELNAGRRERRCAWCAYAIADGHGVHESYTAGYPMHHRVCWVEYQSVGKPSEILPRITKQDEGTYACTLCNDVGLEADRIGYVEHVCRVVEQAS